MRHIRIQWTACVLLSAGCILTVHAAPPQSAGNRPPTQDVTHKTHDPAIQASSATVAFGVKVDASALAKMRAGGDVKNRVKLNGSVSDTKTRHVVTGMNVVSGNAFADAAGLSVVIQNSGNSVLIQNSTVINLQLQQ